MNTKIILLGLLLIAGTAWAQTNNIIISNYSFEGINKTIKATATVIPPGPGSSSGTIGAWNASAFAGVGSTLIGSKSFGSPTPPNGSYAMEVDLPATTLGVLAYVDLNQTLGVSFLTNSIYTLSFEMYRSSAIDASISLENGLTTVASLSASQLMSMTSSGSYSLVSLVFTNIGYTGTIGIDFAANQIVGIGATTFYLDNFQLSQVPITTTPTPEPFISSLLVTGLTALSYKLGGLKRIKEAFSIPMS